MRQIVVLAFIFTVPVANADTFVLHPSKGELVVPAPVCGNDALRERIRMFIGGRCLSGSGSKCPLALPEIVIVGETITLSPGHGLEAFPPIQVVRDTTRWIAWFRGKANAYTIVVSIDPSKKAVPAYLSIIDRPPNKPCAEKWLGEAVRSKP